MSLEKVGAMFRLVDASRVGYMTKPTVIVEADRNGCSKYWDYPVIGIAPCGKNTITVYVIPL